LIFFLKKKKNTDWYSNNRWKERGSFIQIFG
jgi:hypothetical protein